MKSGFDYLITGQSEPDTLQLAGGKLWVLQSGFFYTRENGQRIFVPPSGPGTFADMIRSPVWLTDYGSIPAVFQNIFDQTRYGGPYLLHDWLYASESFDRKTCDWIMLEALQRAGANWFTRNTIYSAVRSAGWNVWRKHDPAEVARLREYEKSFLKSDLTIT